VTCRRLSQPNPYRAAPYLYLGLVAMQEQQLVDAHRQFELAVKYSASADIREGAAASLLGATLYDSVNRQDLAFETLMAFNDISGSSPPVVLELAKRVVESEWRLFYLNWYARMAPRLWLSESKEYIDLIVDANYERLLSLRRQAMALLTNRIFADPKSELQPSYLFRQAEALQIDPPAGHPAEQTEWLWAHSWEVKSIISTLLEQVLPAHQAFLSARPSKKLEPIPAPPIALFGDKRRRWSAQVEGIEKSNALLSSKHARWDKAASALPDYYEAVKSNDSELDSSGWRPSDDWLVWPVGEVRPA
jgi:hypothetical protein